MVKNIKCFLTFLTALLLIHLSGINVSCGRSSNGISTKSGDYKKACKEEDFQTAHDIVDNLHEEFVDVYSKNYGKIHATLDLNTYEKIDCKAINDILEKAQKYGAAAQYVITTEARYLISESSESIPLEELSNLFLELQSIGKKLPKGTNSNPDLIDNDARNYVDINCYIEYVKANNALADLLISLASTKSNSELTNLALSHYLEEPFLDFYNVNYREPEKKHLSYDVNN